MDYYSSLGFVLKQEPIKEYDRRYVFYTQKFGKITLLACGARKINAKLPGHLELPALVQVEFTMSQSPRLISALEKFSFPVIKKNRRSLTVSFLIADLVDKFSFEKQADPEIWKLLSDAFYFLEENFDKFPEIADFVWFYFNAQFLEILGTAPFLEGCVECGKTIDNKFFSFAKKGIVCSKHSQKKDWPMSSNQKRCLNLLFNSSLQRFAQPSAIQEILKERKYIKNFLNEFTLMIKSDIM